MSEAIGVFLTFSTYATHLPAAETGSVARSQNSFGAPTLPPNPAWKDQAARLVSEPPFKLAAEDRAVVLNSTIDACRYRHWHLFCAHVRSNHVHIVLQCDVPAGSALSYLKARATFLLRSRHPDRNRFWTKHGSTRFIWNKESLVAAIDYVMSQQGPVMAACGEQP